MQGNGKQAEAAEAPSKHKVTASEQASDAIKEEENEGTDLPDTTHDAILARQLAEELEGGKYAKACSMILSSGFPVRCP